MKVSVTLAIALVILAIASSAKSESKRREHHVGLPTPHQTKAYIKGFKTSYPEKKSKESHHHKTYLHEDKHNHKGIKHPIEIPPHEGHIQTDLKSPKNSQNIKGHDSWHKKDLHLQDLSFDNVKSHHDSHNTHGHHTKGHHTWPHHSEPLIKHDSVHHKAIKAEEHNPFHHNHKSVGDKSHHHPVASARTMTKSFHHSEHESAHLQPQEPHSGKKSHINKGDHGNWGKTKKQKKAFEKKQKQKQHRKKQFKGELHKLW